MRRILIATDGSPCSLEAVRHFAQLGNPHTVALYLLSVMAHAHLPEGHPAAVEHYEREAATAQAAIDEASQELEAAGFKAYSLTRTGPAAETILEAADELQVDMIVLGTHGRHGIERLLKGSVAEEVLRRAPCAVLISPLSARLELPAEPARELALHA